MGYSAYNALHPTYMILSMNFATGDSGPCYGDSGGPLFLGGTGKVGAITVWGDIMCRAMTAPLRLDTVGARAFLQNHGANLP
ncbi:MAG TPA: trypsin-like serine protease [Gammaproteobacteria bacterium]